MGLFSKKKVPTGPPPPVTTNTFVEPPEGKSPYVAVTGMGGGPGYSWAPVEQQDSGPPYFRPGYRLEPTPDIAPAGWYLERNEQNLKRGQVEKLEASPWGIEEYEALPKLPEPEMIRPLPDRVTGYHSQSNYRFTVEGKTLGLRTPRQLNGNHFSGASNLRAYPLNGMQPATHFRNTYRIQPPVQGNPGLTDMPPEQGNTPVTQITSPSLSPNPGAYRLGS